MFPGAEYIACILVVVVWLIVSALASLIVASVGVLPLATYLIQKTKTHQDRIVGKIPPNGKPSWPWWSETDEWMKIVWLVFFLLFGYVFAGPTYHMVLRIGGA